MMRPKSAVIVLLALTALSSLATFARAQKAGDLKWEPYLFEAAKSKNRGRDGSAPRPGKSASAG